MFHNVVCCVVFSWSDYYQEVIGIWVVGLPMDHLYNSGPD